MTLVRNDDVHFGLIFDIPREPQVTARLTLSQPLYVVAHPKHKISQEKRAKLSDLSQYSIALPEMSYRIRQVIQNAEHDEGLLLEPSLVTNSMDLLKGFAKSGRGITFLPRFLAQPELSDGNLCAIPTNNALLNSTKISLITRSGRQVPPGVYRLMAMVEGYMKKTLAKYP
jgi:DNA-binding transcriptional LysR family regulator